MINYKEIWESLNIESKIDEQLVFAAREIPTNSELKIFLASNYILGKRFLFVLLDKQDFNTLFPSLQGMEISIVKTTLGLYKNKKFLCLKQSVDVLDDIFELVISDIANSLINIQFSNNILTTILNSIERWRLFFQSDTNKLLSIERQKGLFGELFFLRDIVFNKIGFSAAIDSWKGPDNANHDFEFKKSAIEIKTTSGKEHKKFFISSEKQLDKLELDELYLCVLSLNTHNNDIGQTLSDIVEECNHLMSGNVAAQYSLKLKLFKSGYLEENKSDYNLRFTVSQIEYFHIKDNFPRITKDNLPLGLGDLSYSVMISACEKFKINDKELNIL